MKKIIMLFLISLTFIPSVMASECSDEVLKDASKVKVEAIPVTGEEIHYQIKISNLTPNLYIEVYDGDSEEKMAFKYEDSDNGTIIIKHYNIYKKYEYEVSVYSSKEGCNEKLNTLEANTVKYNNNHFLVVCQDNPEYEKCKPFYEPTKEEEKQEYEEFYKEVKEYEEFKNFTFLEKVWYYIKKYGLYVLIPVVVIGGIYTILIFVHKQKEKGAENK